MANRVAAAALAARSSRRVSAPENEGNRKNVFTADGGALSNTSTPCNATSDDRPLRMLALWCLLIPRCFVADTFYLVAWFYLVVWKIESAALLPGGPNPIVQARPKGKRWSGKFS